MIGTHLGERYELTLLLSDGPIFAAYYAQDKVLGREVTVRVIKPPFATEPHFLMKLREVVKGAGSVAQPNVEKMLDLVDDPQASYLVTEFSKGSILAERIRKLAPYSVATSVSIVISILDGLEALHNSHYTHGDAGAHNIIMQENGAARIELPGIWEAYAASDTAGSVMLPAMAPYLAPEVSAGAAPSPAADTYAVGIILYQLLTGRLPYAGDTAVATAMKHTSQPTPSVRASNASVPQALDDFVKRSMAKEPSARYRSAGQMLDDLKQIESTLRFGKSVPAPARPQPAKDVPYAEPAPRPVEPAIGPVGAPAATAPARRTERTYVEEREPRDVPVWLIVICTFVLTVVGVLGFGFYWFSASAPKEMKVPNLVGKSKDDAEAALAKMNLQMKVSKREPSEKVPMDAVLDTIPEAGQEVKDGGVVVVDLSAGSRLVTLPDIRGKTPDQARAILQDLNLDLDRVDPVPTDKGPAGVIVRQSPNPKSKVERFSRVNVGVSMSSTTPAVQTPPAASTNGEVAQAPQSSSSRYLYTIKIRLTKITQPVVLRVDITDANGTRKIYEAQRYPNEEVSIRTEGYGDHAVFMIYYNGEYVTQVSKQADEGTTTNGGGSDTTGDSGDNGDNGGNDNGDGQ